MSKCTTCPFVRIAFNWTVKDQEYAEKIVKLSGVPYSEFMFWISAIIRKAKVE